MLTLEAILEEEEVLDSMANVLPGQPCGQSRVENPRPEAEAS